MESTQQGAMAQATASLSQKVMQGGLRGDGFDELLRVYCTGLNALGMSIVRMHVSLRATHPEFGSIAHHWERDTGAESWTFAHTETPPDVWVTSPLYYLLKTDGSEFRQRLNETDPALDFPIFEELRAKGGTDYIAFKVLFGKTSGCLAVNPNDPPEGCLLSVTSDAPDGFSDEQIAVLHTTLPALVLGLKSGSNRQMAQDIADTYLGKDAGGRVVSGDIVRGSVQQMQAVIAYFDLSGFTRLSEELEGRSLIDMLNVYFDKVVDVVQGYGGEVLKFMGDGLMAVFDCSRVEDANAAGVAAALDLRARMTEINADRAQAALPTTGFTLALHGGEVLYGNIGGRNRLDFTVIGPAVNTAARLSGMCAHVDQNIVISANVARPMMERFDALVSLGTYRLRGVAERQELFTLD